MSRDDSPAARIQQITNAPSEISQEDLDQLAKTISATAGEPIAYQPIEVEKRFEEIAPSPRSLIADRSWFCLGLVYCMIKIDRSLMEAYRYSLNKDVDLQTYQAGKPLFEVNGSESWGNNEWSGIIQGIPHDQAKQFINYIESYQFNRSDTKHVWSCEFHQTTLNDPFSDKPHKADVWLALPFNRTLKRKMVVASPGIGNALPLIGMVRTNG